MITKFRFVTLFLFLIVFSMLIMPIQANAEYSSIEDILSDYRLKGDAYDEFGHPYMAFLNYDKANWESGKNTNYNEVQDYKEFLKQKEDTIKKYGGGNFHEIINRSFEVADYYTTLKYSMIAEEKDPNNWKSYERRTPILLFQGKQNEALENFEKLVETEGAFAKMSSAHISGKLDLLYATDQYSKVLDLFESWRDYSLERGGYGLPPGSTSLTIAMAYEKLDNPHSANYWYDQAESPYFDIVCLKASKLYTMGLHSDVVRLIESNNNYEKCPRDLLFPYVISKDIITNQYHPPVQHEPNPTENTISSSEIICGKGTIRNEFGQCVLDTNSEINSKSKKGGCLIATAAYGTELAPQVQFLREIRDNTVISTASGASFMTGFNQLYYSFSPTIADWERQNPMFQEAVRAFITPMISTLSIMTLAENGSEIEVLVLGISIIALNLGMYIAAPSVVAWQVKKRI